MQQEGTSTSTAETGVPVQRSPGAPSSADVLRALGLDALVELVETSAHGIVVTGEEHRWVYLNPSAARTVGRPFAELQGEDYLLSFAEHERAALLALERDQREGDTGFYAHTVVRPDGTPVEITWSGSLLHAHGQELAPAVFHPTTVLGRTEREAAALGAAAARLADGGPVEEVLETLAEQALTGSRAVGCVVLLETGTDRRLAVVARAGVPARAVTEVRQAQLRLVDLPGGALLSAGRLLLLSDDRSRLRAASVTAPLADVAADLGWEGSAKVPLHRAGEVVGCLVLLLPPSVTAPTETELTFWSALGAHASVALADAALRAQAGAHAAELERRRLGRDLHDSVSSALFALHARAQVVSRALAAGDPELAAVAAADLEQLSTQALTELRSVVNDRRGERAGDLADALEDLARTTSGRDGLPVHVRVDRPVPELPAGTADHVLRIAAEALHNCFKHAAAGCAEVELDVRGSELVLAVRDDGCGFDPGQQARHDRHGQRTMRERALLCGGWLHVDSAPGRGTSVVARVPLPG